MEEKAIAFSELETFIWVKADDLIKSVRDYANSAKKFDEDFWVPSIYYPGSDHKRIQYFLMRKFNTRMMANHAFADAFLAYINEKRIRNFQEPILAPSQTP